MRRRLFISSVVAAAAAAFAPSLVFAKKPLTLEEIKWGIIDTLRPYLFEINDDATRQLVKRDLEKYLSTTGVYDYIVICDEATNGADVLRTNSLHADVAVKLTKRQEFVYFPARLFRDPIGPGILA